MFPLLTFDDDAWPEATATALTAFAEEVGPELVEAERDGRFPREIYEEMGRRGWVGPITPRTHGGLGAGVPEYCFLLEEGGRHGLVSPQVSIQGQRWLLDWGSDEQVGQYLEGIARGEIIFSESISEPGAGSSLKTMRSTATPDGDDWILEGHKTHVNLGAESEVTLMYAMAPQGLTAFLVDQGLPGVTSRQTSAIGLRLIPTAEVHFDAVRVPGSAVLGQPGRGLETFLSTFNMSRLGNASELIGFGRRAIELGRAYAAERLIGDSTVLSFQGIQWTIAEAYERLYAASLARDHAAGLDSGLYDHGLETALAKKLAVSAAEYAVNEVFALVGGHGLYTDQPFSRLLNDTKVLRVAGGSVEVMRNFIARSVTSDDHRWGLP